MGEFIQIYSGNYARLDMGKSRRATNDGRKKFLSLDLTRVKSRPRNVFGLEKSRFFVESM